MQRLGAVLVALVLCTAAAAPIGPGKPEDTKAVACEECAAHKDYLDSKDECVCFATDIAGTFENDATKTSTKRTGSTGEGSGEGTHSFEDTSGG